MHDFLRKKREQIVKERNPMQGEASKTHDDGYDENTMPNIGTSMASTTMVSQTINKEHAIKQKVDKQRQLMEEQIKSYKLDFVRYFEMKVTKQEVMLDNGSNNHGSKIPKRKKLDYQKDNIESLSENVRTLINFGRYHKEQVG